MPRYKVYFRKMVWESMTVNAPDPDPVLVEETINTFPEPSE